MASSLNHLIILLLGSERNTTKTISIVNESRAADASDAAYGLTVKKEFLN